MVKEETRNQIVVSLNPGTVYWMDIFHIDLLLNFYFQLKRLKINEKDAGVVPSFKSSYLT